MDSRIIKQSVIGCSIAFMAFLSSVLAFTHLSNAEKLDHASKEWMAEIDDSKYLSELSLPGTHDSGALYSIGDLAGICQDFTIEKQLRAGTRFLDLRLELKGNSLKVVHGIVDERDTFENVVGVCKEFLESYPSETIVMSIKEENVNDNGKFTEVLESRIQKNPDLWYTGSDIPTLGEARGKIVLLCRYKNNTLGVNLYNGWANNATFDINVGTSTYHIQDHFKLDDTDSKWADIQSCFAYSNANASPTVYTINFMSGYLDKGFPPSYSVPVAKDINKKALKDIPNYQCTGTVLFDFINEELAKAVYERNFQ